MSQQNTDVLICSCNSPEHQLLFTYDKEDCIVYVTCHLNKFPFFKRIVHGLKYIFGHTSIYGDFDEFLLDSSHKDKIMKVYECLNDLEDK